MKLPALLRRHPVPSVASIAFIAALALTVAFSAGYVPGIPKTLPTFVKMLMVTSGLLVVAVLAWVGSISTSSHEYDTAVRGLRLRDGVSVLTAVLVFLAIANATGFGSLAVTFPGVLLVALVGYVGFRVGRTVA